MTTVALAQRFANWSLDFSLADAPASVLAAARRAIFDTLGVIVAGSVHPQVKALAAAGAGRGGKCSLAGCAPRDAEAAALVNGMAAHVWDFDDTSYTGIMHGSAVILPVVLALSEDAGATEDDLIAAFIVGSEITYTLADVCTHDHYFRGWWSTGTFGLVGAAAAAARVLKLDRTRAANAIGLAAAAAGGGKSLFGTDAKALLVGETARRGIAFARFAQIGLTGPAGAFEDPRGFLALLNGGKANWPEADTLGQRWRLVEPGLLFKTSPVCSAAHAAIEQMSTLVSEAGIAAGKIASIEAEIPELVNISLVYQCPKGPQQAQFSLPYALACAALHGSVRLGDLAPAEIAAPEKVALMKKIEVKVVADLSTEAMRAKYPESARLIVNLRDGRTLSGFCGSAYGMPDRPLSETDMHQKFARCLEFAGRPASDIDLDRVNLLALSGDVLRGSQTLH